MYICNNCGNREKFIGYAEEKGSATIIQQINCHHENYYIKDGPAAQNMISARIPSKNNSLSFTYKDFNWFYNMSDNSWKGRFKIYKCYYCLSEDISFL